METLAMNIAEQVLNLKLPDSSNALLESDSATPRDEGIEAHPPVANGAMPMFWYCCCCSWESSKLDATKDEYYLSS
jgi:hypothetical protein